MLVLAIETGSGKGSVALLDGGRAIAEEPLGERGEHERNLLPRIEAVVRGRGFEPSDLGLVAVGLGPGSFTGLRIGITCAKTLAFVLGKDLVGVPTFEALPANVPAGVGRCAPVLDAKRGQVYGAAFRREGDRWIRETENLLFAPADLAARIPRPATVFGDGAERYSGAFPAGGFARGDPAWAIARASEIGRLALALHAAGRRDSPYTLEPVYLCLSSAEEKRRGP